MPTQRSYLLNDADLAAMLRMSRSWVRKERFNRRHGLPHALDVDPVLIGSVPRYRADDISTWLERRSTEPILPVERGNA